MQVRPGIELASLSDIGCQRQENEDSYGYWEPESEEQFRQRGRLVIIADGMGGYEGGREASHLAVETVCQVYSDSAGQEPQPALLAALHEAHARIRQYALEHPNLRGMGTTCTAVSLTGGQLHFAHVGDTRLYLVRGEQISRLTHDHSYVGRLVESGLLNPEEAQHHPQRHILTAALGSGDDVTPDSPTAPVALHPGDILLLCTDGLWDLLRDEELMEILSRYPPTEASQQLVQMAKSRGGPDNITLQILRIKS